MVLAIADPTSQPSLLVRLAMPAVLVLGLIICASWTAVLGYGAFELLERTL